MIKIYIVLFKSCNYLIVDALLALPATQIDNEEVAHVRVSKSVDNCPKIKGFKSLTKFQRRECAKKCTYHLIGAT